MPGICRLNDTVGAGTAISTQSTVFANGRAVIVNGDPVTPHAPHGSHDSSVLISGSSSVFVGGKLVVRSGDLATCGDMVTG